MARGAVNDLGIGTCRSLQTEVTKSTGVTVMARRAVNDLGFGTCHSLQTEVTKSTGVTVMARRAVNGLGFGTCRWLAADRSNKVYWCYCHGTPRGERPRVRYVSPARCRPK